MQIFSHTLALSFARLRMNAPIVQCISNLFALDFIEFKTIQITLLEAELTNTDWQKWLNDFAKNQQQGRNGTLTFLGPNLKDVLMEIALHNVVIVSTLFHGDATNTIARFSLELMFDFASIITTTKAVTKEVKFIRSSMGVLLPELANIEIKPQDGKKVKV